MIVMIVVTLTVHTNLTANRIWGPKSLKNELNV